MTMHLLRGAPGLNTKKPKVKYTKAKLATLRESHKKHNKWAKSNRMPDMIMDFDDYLLFTRGLWKPKTIHQPTPKPRYQPPAQDKQPEYPSMGMKGKYTAFKKEPMKYTGTLVTGIAQMHKSNAVPIINKEQAIEVAKMRRG